MNRAALLSIGLATPAHSISQETSARLACELLPESDQRRGIAALYRRTGIESRGSVLAGAEGGIEMYAPGAAVPGTSERLRRFTEHAGELATSAAGEALSRAGVRAEDITHLVVATCTGFDAPGFDQRVIRSLGLQASVRRTQVGFMGCHAAINALAVAAAYAESDPAARVLVCCAELCTLHFSYAGAPDRVVANSLFADGAAAAVVACSDAAPVRLSRFASTIIPGTAEHMRWVIGDAGFEMTLSPGVPDVLAAQVPTWVRGWLDAAGLGLGDVASWAIHPGGPRVLASVAEALGVEASACEASREILRTHGNMSSATILFIIERMLREGAPLPMVALAFGPGLAGEGLLLGGPEI